MASLNKVLCIGNLGQDPTTRYMPDGAAVTNFSVGCNWKSKDTEGCEWVRCSAFGKLAEICGEYLKKGSQVYVDGRLQTRKWKDKDGKDNYTTEVVLERMQMLGGKPRDEEKPAERKPEGVKETGSSSFGDFEDDLPF